MRGFEDICCMTQQEVKQYMQDYLTSKQYDVKSEEGFLYAKGDIPVLLVAHMDTVHTTQCTLTSRVDGKISSPQGIGGDDRCGIFIIANIVKDLHCSVLLCEDEEKGGIGANKFVKSEYLKSLDVNYMIEFDRMGSDDAVFYHCDNRDFIDYVTDFTGYKETTGTFSDISILAPASKICGVNLSSGYYKPHTTDEYVIYDEMMDTIGVAKALINAECDGPFEYKAKVYSSAYPTTTSRLYQSVAQSAIKDLTLELEVIIIDANGREQVYYGSGNTKAECWFDFFANHPYVCFNQVIDYVFM